MHRHSPQTRNNLKCDERNGNTFSRNRVAFSITYGNYKYDLPDSENTSFASVDAGQKPLLEELLRYPLIRLFSHMILGLCPKPHRSGLAILQASAHALR